MSDRLDPGTVMTVNGPIPADSLGVALPHEHLIVQGWDHTERNYLNSISREVQAYLAAGGNAIVDVSPIGMPRDPLFARRVASRTGALVVLGTGFYCDAWLTEEVRGMTTEGMAGLMVAEITDGMDGTDVRAGVIGEMGVSRRITSTEERALRAAAQAHQRTGVAISLHFEIESAPSEYHHALDILEAEGADLGRVAIGHLVPRADNLDIHRGLAGRGCFLEFDLFGQERRDLTNDLVDTPAAAQIASVKGYGFHGLLKHLLVSQDVRHVDLLGVSGSNGYAHILRDVVPVWNMYGLDAAAVWTLMVDNPRRFLEVPAAPAEPPAGAGPTGGRIT